MTKHEINGYSLLMVDVPEGIVIQGIDKIDQVEYLELIVNNEEDFMMLPSGNWQLLGLASEVTEEEAAGVVESGKYWDGYPPGLGMVTYYREYPKDIEESFELRANASLCSFVRAQGKEPQQTVLLYTTKNK
jgi:hypothetical protein